MIDNLRQLVKNGVENGVFPGAVLCLYKEKPLFIESYGNRMIIPKQLPMFDNALFDMASLTKPVATAPSIMILKERGDIDLDAEVNEYLPEFSRKGITIFHLLTHTSGLPAWRPLYLDAGYTDNVINFLGNLPLEYETGSKVIYSCLGYILLGKIISKITGMGLDKFTSENIFEPLGMNDTFFNPPESRYDECVATEDSNSAEKRMTNYRDHKWREGVIVGEVHDENSHFLGGVAGNAGLFSTASDLAKFARMLINKGNDILSSDSVKMMSSNQTPGLDESRGIGWIILQDGVLYHTGYTGTAMWIDLENRASAILLTNRVHPDASNISIIEFRQIFYRNWRK